MLIRLRPWLVGVAVFLGGCTAAPGSAPDPAATEAAIGAAIAATGTALAGSISAQPAITSVPSTATVASSSTAVTSPTSAATPRQDGTPSPTIPIGTPRPAVTRTLTPLTSEEAAYVRSVVPFISQFNQSFDRFAELIRQANPEDASWRLALSAELRLWSDGAEAARGTRPPESMLPVHRHVVAGLDSYREAGRLITDALQRGDTEQVRKGLESVQQGRRSFAEASTEINRLAEERGL